MQTILRDEIETLRNLSDSSFDHAFTREVRAEAKQSLRVVYFIREANRRKHWLRNFSTLAKYCAHHGISNGDFYRKLSVLNTIREVPEVEEKILEGTLNPSTVAQINSFCRSEAKLRAVPVTIEEKRELLLKAEGQCAKSVERELARISPKSATPDKKRQIAENLFSNQFTSDQALEDKFTRLRELLSNSLPNCPTQNELLHKVCDLALKQIDPVTRKESGKKRNQQQIARTRHIPLDIKRVVNLRDGGQCTFIHENGQRCEAKSNLQFDHITPFAKGGNTAPENLRQLCRNHNQWLAIKEYGREKMAGYLPSF